MTRARKIVLSAVAVVAAVVLIVVIVGLLLPGNHVATVEGRYAAAPGQLYEAITDVSDGPSWRSGLQKVDVLSRPGEPLQWRETADWGTLTFVHDVNETDRRVVARIVDEDQGFGGTWTYDITPLENGTLLRITENGTVSNPAFRFMSRFVFGHYSGIEMYVRDLGRSFGEDVEPARVAE